MSELFYLTAIPPEAQIHRGQIRYEYRIACQFSRKHCNPPLWNNFHAHTFSVVLELAADRPETGLFGLDMCAIEQSLMDCAEALPEVLNDCPLCPHGTTEELCHYFAALALEPHIDLLSVAVSEAPERTTILRLRAGSSS
jgi:6-pyruvoyl-tetrahydropterin synthase